MSKLSKPADYHLGTNPALKKTNSPFRFWVVFISVGLLILAVWYLFPTRLRITNVRLEFSGDHVATVGQAINDTDSSVTATLRFTICTQLKEPNAGIRILVLGERFASYELPPHSATTVGCEFPLPSVSPTLAEIQILKSSQKQFAQPITPPNEAGR